MLTFAHQFSLHLDSVGILLPGPQLKHERAFHQQLCLGPPSSQPALACNEAGHLAVRLSSEWGAILTRAVSWLPVTASWFTLLLSWTSNRSTVPHCHCAFSVKVNRIYITVVIFFNPAYITVVSIMEVTILMSCIIPLDIYVASCHPCRLCTYQYFPCTFSKDPSPTIGPRSSYEAIGEATQVSMACTGVIATTSSRMSAAAEPKAIVPFHGRRDNGVARVATWQSIGTPSAWRHPGSASQEINTSSGEVECLMIRPMPQTQQEEGRS
ncbi:hypothetical protein B0I35DRAFT_232781 [Stachybotrys elegans]|uniref:Uncharacterized protein n=1 Tax=Stachybotrys elegans TaxID=80388 RepID=A0A8K0SS06_9HYPO|nr:hypothetical protein B0I35DRAFT_232781 [Stachybotrys elegans]